ncbi:cytidylate kinase-like family protein [Myxococcota bacterium]|nr:cytidylate kinase-like family protein [Myxococcota bacterium]
MTQPRSIEQLVEAQVRRWQAMQEAPPKVEKRQPVVTVSREHGALGGELAKRLADKLGFELWDKALLEAVAARSGASRAMIETFDEHTRSGLEDMLAGMVYGVAATEGEYVRELARVIYAVSIRGKSVILGRGAAFVLKPHAVLRVRVVCPLEQRTARIMARDHLSRDAAEKEIHRVDRDRARFNEKSWGRVTSDDYAYDLVINTAYLPIEHAVDVVAAAHAAKFAAAER